MPLDTNAGLRARIFSGPYGPPLTAGLWSQYASQVKTIILAQSAVGDWRRSRNILCQVIDRLRVSTYAFGTFGAATLDPEAIPTSRGY